jgi:hypothetical protein
MSRGSRADAVAFLLNFLYESIRGILRAAARPSAGHFEIRFTKWLQQQGYLE